MSMAQRRISDTAELALSLYANHVQESPLRQVAHDEQHVVVSVLLYVVCLGRRMFLWHRKYIV
jgi:hypothetical protein